MQDRGSALGLGLEAATFAESGGHGRSGRRLFRRGQARPDARLRPRQRDGRLAADRNRPRGAARARLPRLAGDPDRGLPRQRDDGGIGRDLGRHRAGKHARGAGGRLPRQSVRQRPTRLRRREGHLPVCVSSGGRQHDGQRDVRRHQPLSGRVRRLGERPVDLADVVARRHGGRSRPRPGAPALQPEASASLEADESLRSRVLPPRLPRDFRAGLRRLASRREQELPAGVPLRAATGLGRLPFRPARSGSDDTRARHHREFRHSSRHRSLPRGDPERVAAAAAGVHGRDLRDDCGSGRRRSGTPADRGVPGASGIGRRRRGRGGRHPRRRKQARRSPASRSSTAGSRG